MSYKLGQTGSDILWYYVDVIMTLPEFKNETQQNTEGILTVNQIKVPSQEKGRVYEFNNEQQIFIKRFDCELRQRVVEYC